MQTRVAHPAMQNSLTLQERGNTMCAHYLLSSIYMEVQMEASKQQIYSQIIAVSQAEQRREVHSSVCVYV